DQRTAPELDGIQLERVGELVHVLLECPAHLRSGRSADRGGRLVVRVVEVRLDADVVDLVRAASMHRRHLCEEASLPAVRALVDDEPSAPRNERAVVARSGLELDRHALASVADGEELLATREDELHGSAGRAGEGSDVALEMEVALRSETSAEQRDDHANLRLRNLQHMRDAAAGDVR